MERQRLGMKTARSRAGPLHTRRPATRRTKARMNCVMECVGGWVGRLGARGSGEPLNLTPISPLPPFKSHRAPKKQHRPTQTIGERTHAHTLKTWVCETKKGTSIAFSTFSLFCAVLMVCLFCDFFFPFHTMMSHILVVFIRFSYSTGGTVDVNQHRCSVNASKWLLLIEERWFNCKHFNRIYKTCLQVY